jgi:hypothetical protein
MEIQAGRLKRGASTNEIYDRRGASSDVWLGDLRLNAASKFGIQDARPTHEAKPAAVRRERPHCYICGTTENLTKDHIPLKGFFPPGDCANLITAPLCCNCHSPFANMDEQMRVWISAGTAAT